MKALLLCDRESSDACGLDLAARVENIMRTIGYEVNTVVLDSDSIKSCVGCFGCWVKTPGLCVITNDSANDISNMEINADALVLLSRITYGGYSADIKAFLDRSIPNILPYFEIYKGEMHHKMRYSRFPAWITIGYGETTGREKETFCALAERNALNLRPPMHSAFTVQNSDEADDVFILLENTLREAAKA